MVCLLSSDTHGLAKLKARYKVMDRIPPRTWYLTCGHGSHMSKQLVSQAYDPKKSDNVGKGSSSYMYVYVGIRYMPVC